MNLLAEFRGRLRLLIALLKKESLILILFCVFFIDLFLFRENQVLAAAFFSTFIHLNRKDLIFIEIAYWHSKKIIFLEYLILLTPFLCLSFLLKDKLFYCSPLLIIYVYFLSQNLALVKLNKSNFKFKPSWLISKQNYEWISGIKEDKGRILMITILLLAISLLSKQILVFSGYLFILLLILIRFYSNSEPFNILELRGLHYRTVIRKTCVLHFKDYSKLVLPLFMVQTLLFYNQPLFIYSISGLICSYILIVYFVVNKYDEFEPHSLSHLKNLKNTLLSFSVLIPFLIIIPIALIIKNYPSKNLEVNVRD